MTQEQYQAVSAELKRRYGITAADAGFGPDEYDLEHEIVKLDAGGLRITEVVVWTPEEFVEWFGEKYDLTPREEWLGWPGGRRP